jgi:hypothetical protein
MIKTWGFGWVSNLEKEKKQGKMKITSNKQVKSI